jgi:hypothetical protein
MGQVREERMSNVRFPKPIPNNGFYPPDCECLRCQYQWLRYVARPKVCPNCGSRAWRDIPRRP